MKRILGMAGLAVAAMLAGGMLLLLSDGFMRRLRYQRLDAIGRLRSHLLLNLQLLAWLEPEPGQRQREKGGTQTETLQELREKGQRLLEAEAVPLPLKFIEGYEEAIYGGRPVQTAMFEEAAEERKVLLLLLKRKKGWRYTFYWVRLFPAFFAHGFSSFAYTDRNGSDT